MASTTMTEDEDQIEYDAWIASIPKFSFEEWIDRFFNRDYNPEDNDCSGYSYLLNQEDFRDFHMWTNLAAPHVTRLFHEPEFLLERYTIDQIGSGIYNVTSMACAHLLSHLRSGEADLEEGFAWIRSVLSLNQRLFTRIAPLESQTENADRTTRRPNGRPLQEACSMFWDILRDFKPRADDRPRKYSVPIDLELHHQIDVVCIEVMKDILSIDHSWCQGSALHGLGHWHEWEPELVEEVIDEFVESGRAASKDISVFAQMARTGRIL